jgi:hypothetical protein
MKKTFYVFLLLIISICTGFGQEKNQEIILPTNYFNHETGFPSIPLWSKVTLELKLNNDSTYYYRITDFKPFEKMYSLDKDSSLFNSPLKENTIELFFIGAYYNEGKEDNDYKTVLIFKSAVNNHLDFKADIKYYYNEEFENTSIAGAFFNVKSTEIWAHKIDYIVLYDFKIMEKL